MTAAFVRLPSGTVLNLGNVELVRTPGDWSVEVYCVGATKFVFHGADNDAIRAWMTFAYQLPYQPTTEPA